MKKSLSIAASIAMALGSIVALAPVAQAAPSTSDFTVTLSSVGNAYSIAVTTNLTQATGSLSDGQYRFDATPTASILFYGSSSAQPASVSTSRPAGVIFAGMLSVPLTLPVTAIQHSNTSAVTDAYIHACVEVNIESSALGAGSFTRYTMCSAGISNPNAQGSIVSQPVLTLSQTAVTVTPSQWSSGSFVDYLVVCSSPRNTAVTSAQPQSSVTTGCRPLYLNATQGDLTMATDLSTAYVSVMVNGVATRVPFDSSVHGSDIGIISINGGSSSMGVAVATATMSVAVTPSQPVETTPYTGPVVNAPGALKPVAPGAKVVIPGSNLTGVSKATINGKDAAVKVSSAGALEIVVPADLAAGTYDLVITSNSGLLTVQDAIRVQAAPNGIKGEATDASTRLKDDNTVKVYVFNVVGAGKVQIMHNGKEVAWVNTDDPDDAKILNDYLVRTLELLNGKNIIEIYVNGVRIDRKAYTKVVADSSDRI